MADWNALRWDDLMLGERDTAILAASIGLSLALIVLMARLSSVRNDDRQSDADRR